MSMLNEPSGNGTPTETSLQRGTPKLQIDGILQQFDVLPSRLDRGIFKSIYVYLVSLFFLAELLPILFLPRSMGSQLPVRGVLLWCTFAALSMVAFISVLWTFQSLRLSTPKTLRDLVEKKRISLPNSDANQSYLRFLEHYRDALASPKRYFVSGFAMAVFVILHVTYLGQYFIPALHPNTFATILLVVSNLFYVLFYLGGLYCLGIVAWVEYISGWYLRKLVRAFPLRIQPFHPDQCGGLKPLGNFCFGLASPILIGSGLNIGQILLFLLSEHEVAATFLTLNVGLLLALLYAFPGIVFAFMLPLWEIHTKMRSEGERDEDGYVARIEALREEIQSLLDTNRVEEAKAVQDKKALVEALHVPYPTWPFRFRSKIFSTVLKVSGSLLIGVITAALQQYFLPVILQSLFHNP